ncbi:MAG: competence protein ComEA [Faecalibacterium prausnitzii]
MLAFRFAVPLQAQTPQTLPDTKELAAYTQVELNTADADALCTLPGVGTQCTGHSGLPGAVRPRLHRWRMRQPVPGMTQAMVDSWAGQAYVR